MVVLKIVARRIDESLRRLRDHWDQCVAFAEILSSNPLPMDYRRFSRSSTDSVDCLLKRVRLREG